MIAVLSQLAGGAVAVFLIASLLAWILGKVTELEKQLRLGIGFLAAPIAAAFIWVYGTGDGDFSYFAQGLLLYSGSAFWALITAVFAGKLSKA
ncbi:hypothetical protein C7U60_09465 [Mesorhizobium plurifarium]|uniref:hypothetical protein n=1 Tax=Sinorhizobium arboris TaxID=76745 RepID=UPI000411808F|nr:hypothetical protein [Sinorhizobium arboris]PST24139.1 hypothetical protein C7U60_09465 [Mesorhizobium plurifarium]